MVFLILFLSFILKNDAFLIGFKSFLILFSYSFYLFYSFLMHYGCIFSQTLVGLYDYSFFLCRLLSNFLLFTAFLCISAYWKYIEQTFAYFPTCICIVALEWTGLCTRVERTVYSSEKICSLECNDTDSSRKKW